MIIGITLSDKKKWLEDGVKVISEDDLDDNTPQTKGMKRYAAVAKKMLVQKKYGQEKLT